MLTITNLTYRIAGRVIFDDASVNIDSGKKVGLIGRNGTGKTTLMSLIAGDLDADSGTISIGNGLRLGRVSQDAPGGDSTLIDFVLAADEERGDLLARAESVDDANQIADIHERLVAIDAGRAPARAARILSGLGFDEAAQKRPLSSYSGGWRMRVALAAALAARPDLLLLDEPTNHLDLEAATWLVGYLNAWRGTLVVVSHDRHLLNAVVDEVVHVSGLGLVRYRGNYDVFERTRAERQEREVRLRDRQEAERKRLAAFVDRFRAQATKARQAQSRVKMLARMQPIPGIIEDASMGLSLPEPDELQAPLVAVEGADVGYGDDPPVLRSLGLRIDPDDRIGLLGANGNGKSTLIKLLAGRLKPRTGSITLARKLGVGYFAQHQVDEFDLTETSIQHIRRLLPNKDETGHRTHLGRFGLSGPRAETQIGNLSGGEKARLLFAVISTARPQLLLLDEPTNHLDVEARAALVEALNAYTGAVMLVSHDSHLLGLVCDRLWLVADGDCKPFDGDLDDYRKWVMESRRGGNGGAKEDRPAEDVATPENVTHTRAGRREARQARAAASALRRHVRDAEKRVEKLAAEKDQLEQRLADPALYEGDPATLGKTRQRHIDLTRDLAAAEAAWLAAESEMEASDADA